MKNINTICLFILLISSVNVFGQSVTFQSYMESSPWAEQVLLNGEPLVELSPDVFEISPSSVLPGKNIIQFVPKPININGPGITASDLVLLRKAIIEIVALDPTTIISGDVNKSNFIGVEDIIISQNKILGLDPVDFELVFVHSGIDLTTLDIFDFGMNVYEFCFNGTDIDNIDFLFDVYLTGDLNQSAKFKPTNGSNTEVRSDKMLLSFSDKDVIAGENFEIPFTFSADDEIEGFQLELENKGIIIESIELESNDHEIKINNTIDNQTRMVLMSDNASTEIKGTIKGSSLENVRLSEVISISTDFKVEVVYSDFTTSGASIEFGITSTNDEVTIDKLLISPNPVQDQFSIQIPSNLQDRSTFTITNTQGQVVINQKDLNGSLVLNKSDLGPSGLYLLTWAHGDKSVHKKLIVQ